MERYKGHECVFCKEVFRHGDDVVVCPECGAPYHRDCYKEMGECVFCKENGEGSEYDYNNYAGKSEETIKCRFCGSVNERDALFCSKCSRSLMDNDRSEPFSSGKEQEKTEGQAYGQGGCNQGYDRGYNSAQYQRQSSFFVYGGADPEEEINGCKVKDVAVFTGPSSASYIAKFKDMWQRKSWVSFNFSSFFFTYYFFFYRKMYKEAIFYALLNNIGTIPALIVSLGSVLNYNVSDFMQTLAVGLSYLLFFIRILFSLFGNRLYMEKCFKTIKDAKAKNLPETLCNEEIAKKGGVSLAATYLAAAVSVLLNLVISLIIVW